MINELLNLMPDFAKFSHLDPLKEFSTDPTDFLSFTNSINHEYIRFDKRKDSELVDVMFANTNAMERERAVWELLERRKAEVIEIVEDYLGKEKEESNKQSALWALQRFSGKEGLDLIYRTMEATGNVETKSWAGLFLKESTGKTHFIDTREYVFDNTNIFDQTLPLLISGYALVNIPHIGWIQATLSPKWFESILGRVLACTNEATFDTDLVIEKRISNYHPDGTDHFEIFKFKGFTLHPTPGITHHIYESRTYHPFYPSGKVKDNSVPALHDVGVILNRLAEPWIIRPTRPVRQQANILVGKKSKKIPSEIVDSVRGKYFGTAYLNIERMLKNNFSIGPGEVQLSSLFHPIAGPLTNMFIFGTFKGKIADLNNDNKLDVNTEVSHGTLDGQLDYSLNGSPSPDPFVQNIKN